MTKAFIFQHVITGETFKTTGENWREAWTNLKTSFPFCLGPLPSYQYKENGEGRFVKVV